jgi:rhodanese-related sulfurtransferase/CBS domain-containing protein
MKETDDIMPTVIQRDEVQRLMATGALLVEVLPREEYEDEHIAGAVNIPLKEINRESAARLEQDQAIIVYCWDQLWDLSPRAAWRLESLGFSQVYDYAAGKADWLAFDLPTEGRDGNRPRVAQVARRDAPTCALSDRVGEVRERVQAADWDECVVVNEARVVLGRLRGPELAVSDDTIVEEVMESGPSTIRPDESLEQLLPRMRGKHVAAMVVTTPDGRLFGIVERDATERVMAAREVKEPDHAWTGSRACNRNCAA